MGQGGLGGPGMRRSGTARYKAAALRGLAPAWPRAARALPSFLCAAALFFSGCAVTQRWGPIYLEARWGAPARSGASTSRPAAPLPELRAWEEP